MSQFVYMLLAAIAFMLLTLFVRFLNQENERERLRERAQEWSVRQRRARWPSQP